MRGISVCGLGKLGAPIAAVFAASEVPVIGYDLDAARVRAINQFVLPLCEPEMAEYLGLDEVQRNLRATTNISEAVHRSDVCMFVTPTPSLPNGAFDHSRLLSAITTYAREIARQRKSNYLFIVNSTVVPGFLDREVRPVLDRLLESYKLAYKPEFIALGTVLRDLCNPDVLLIGQDSEETGLMVEKLYRLMVFQNPPAKRMSLIEAELAKISLNCAVTMKISFANQVGLVAEALGADPCRVLDAVGADRRIGPLALKPGLPFGGPCFPRDNRMFQFVAAAAGERAPLAEATDVMNRRMLRVMLDRVLPDGEVGILGLAYKPGTHVTDESAGAWWRQALTSRGRRVRAHDVSAAHAHTLEEVLACPTVIVACAWPEYSALPVRPGTKLIDPMGVVKEVLPELELANAAD
jgi:UDPglucose 6-dehydrogenase